jgi:cytidylate kinase
MKRTIAAVVTAVAATGSTWLATAPAYAKPVPKPPTATLRIMARWTYLGGGKFAVATKCSERKDLRVIFSPLLYRPVVVPGAGNLLIQVTGKTKPGKYAIGLECVDRRQVDAVVVKTVTVRKRLAGWTMAPPPSLPRHFKPDLTVRTGVRRLIVRAPKPKRR